MTSSPSGTDAAASSASSSVCRRPKTTSSAIVSSGIQSTRLEGSPPRPKPAAEDSAASSISNGALPLRRIPSGSAMSAAPAVLKAVQLLRRTGGLSQRREIDERAREVIGRQPIHRCAEVVAVGQRLAAFLHVDDGLDAGARLAEHQHVANERIGAAVGHLDLDVLVGLRREAEPAARRQLAERILGQCLILDVDDDDRLGGGDVPVGRPSGQRDLVAEPRLDLLAVVERQPGGPEQVLDDLVNLLIERGLVGESRQATDQSAEVHLLAGRWLQVDVDVEGAVRRRQRGGAIARRCEEQKVAGEEGGSGKADESDEGDDDSVHSLSARAGRRGRHPASASCRR